MNVAIVQDYNGVKHSAKIKIMNLIRKFVKVAGQGCTIILLSGDADYYDTLSGLKNLHNVSIHQIGLANSFSFKIAQISDHTFMLNNGVLEPQNIVNINDCGSYERSIFFQFDSFDVPLFIWKDLTKWSVLYDLYEQLYDLGAKKVMLAWRANAWPIYNTVFHRDLYCASFGSASAYRDAFEEIRLRNLKAYEFVNIPESYKHEVAVKMSRYNTIDRIPCKKILDNRECIFIKCIKKTPGEIWIGFPNELICKNSEKTVNGFLSSLKQSSNVLVAKPSNELLKSINFQDLAGDAYDLAFLSSQLDGTQPSPNIIERISLQRMQEQECDEAVFFITIEGDFSNSQSWVELRADQIIKIFVKFSKVIPLAAAMKEKVFLMFHSWYEAQVARHFLNNLTLSEVPYFKELSKVSEVNKQQLTSLNFMRFYIINDQRNVLEKIMQNRSLVHKLDFNSSIVQSTSEIDPADGQVANRLKYVFTITSSEFKFTRGMISIIKMRLVFMKCPAYIEFEDKIWFGVDDLKKGNKIENEFRFLTFQILHEDDDYDQLLYVAVQSVSSFPPKVGKMLADKLNDQKKPSAGDDLIISDLDLDTVPLGHFNYSYKKAVGMSIGRYIELDNLASP
uniref:NYN domain-containing protein n=1 Tax=Tetranychus urticae TaxID=32264 RepID=T1KGI1_TETUR